MTIASASRSLAVTIFIAALSSYFFNSDCIAGTQDKATQTYVNQLPPLEAGVTELIFSEFFKMPVGPRGLEPSEKLQSLNGKRVRITGYMVEEEESKPGIFILSPHAISLSEVDDGPADDLPAAHLTVHAPEQSAKNIAPYRSGLITLNGQLDIGNSEESNGRLSFVRLWLDAPVQSQSKPHYKSTTLHSNKNQSPKTALQNQENAKHNDNNSSSAT